MFPAVCRVLAARVVLFLGLLGLVGACTARPEGVDIFDPYESVNRAWFERNLAVDRAFTSITGTHEEISPAGRAMLRAVRNAGSNLSIPRTVINNLLQVRPERAAENTVRFLVNSTVGIGGLFDVAGAIGIHGRSTDFGETLHVWGVEEGAYLVMPFLGPTTERDAVGTIVDNLMSPWSHVLDRREARIVSGLRLASHLADRLEYADLIDANVMRSADPYAQARLLFLQGRRYHLGIDAEEQFIDPYADF